MTDPHHGTTDGLSHSLDQLTQRWAGADAWLLRQVFPLLAELVADVLPRLFGARVSVESVDPVERSVVRLQIGPDGVESVEPATTVATMPTSPAPPVRSDSPDLAPPADIRTHFCHHIHHFGQPESAARFTARDPRRSVLHLEDFHALAQELCSRVW